MKNGSSSIALRHQLQPTLVSSYRPQPGVVIALVLLGSIERRGRAGNQWGLLPPMRSSISDTKYSRKETGTSDSYLKNSLWRQVGTTDGKILPKRGLTWCTCFFQELPVLVLRVGEDGFLCPRIHKGHTHCQRWQQTTLPEPESGFSLRRSGVLRTKLCFIRPSQAPLSTAPVAFFEKWLCNSTNVQQRKLQTTLWWREGMRYQKRKLPRELFRAATAPIVNILPHHRGRLLDRFASPDFVCPRRRQRNYRHWLL